jgi:thiamine pyrophosphokinase
MLWFVPGDPVHASTAFEKICADGGANRVYSFFKDSSSSTCTASIPAPYMPSIILGDLDSLSSNVRECYTRHGVPIQDLSNDQDSTDLDKCLAHVERRQAEEGRSVDGTTDQEDLVVVVGGYKSLIMLAAICTAAGAPKHSALLTLCPGAGALGGRLDHTLGNLNSLYTHPTQQIVLLGEGNVVRLLQPGTTHVHVDRESEGLHCGVIPLNGPVTVSSKGLKWDMGASLPPPSLSP